MLGGSVSQGTGLVLLLTVANVTTLSSPFSLLSLLSGRGGGGYVFSPRVFKGGSVKARPARRMCSCRRLAAWVRPKGLSRPGPRGGRLEPQAGTTPPRQEDLSRHYLRPVVPACSRASGAGTRCPSSGGQEPRCSDCSAQRGSGGSQQPRPGRCLFPVPRHAELSPLRLLRGASLASVCGSLPRDGFQGPELGMKSHL